MKLSEEDFQRFTSGDKSPQCGNHADRILATVSKGDAVTISRKTLDDIISYMEHSIVFITSKQKMHKVGVDQHNELLKTLKSL